MQRLFAAAVALAGWAAGVSGAAAEVYIRQLDQGGGVRLRDNGGNYGSVYIPQLPADARPVPPPRARVVRQPTPVAAAPQQPARPPAPAAVPVPARQAFPDVGPGVAVALAPAVADSRLPNVGRGLVRP